MSDIVRSSCVIPRRGLSMGRCIAAGFQVAVIASAVFALAEGLSRIWLLSSYFGQDGRPWRLICAALGMMAISHLILWCPIMLVAGIMYGLIGKRSERAVPEAFLSGLILLVAGLLLAPVAVRLANVKSHVLIEYSRIPAALLAILCYIVLRWLHRKMRPVRYRRIFAIATLAALLLDAGTGMAFYHSPFFHPSEYRVPPSVPITQHLSRPHVLWIDLDTTRADHLSCYGYARKTTPFLEQWARQSMVFDRAVSNGNWTVPTHASMFTGMSVRQHGVDWGHTHLDDDQKTIAQHLRDAGYATAFFSNNLWLTPEFQLVKGFESFRNVYQLKRLNLFSLALLVERWGLTPRLPWFDWDFGAALTNHLAARWLDDHDSEGHPLFLFVHYMAAHWPYQSPRHYRQMYMTGAEVDRSYDLRRRVYGGIINALKFRYNLQGGGFLPARDRDILRDQYDSAIRYQDDRVGEVIGMFKQRGLLENTLVVITSDHGECLGTHSMWGHLFQVYDDLSHVLLTLREPGRNQGVRIKTPVQQSDLYETVLKAALDRVPDVCSPDSRDLLTLAVAGGEPRIAMCQCSKADPRIWKRMLMSPDPAKRHRAIGQWGATDGHYKYIASRDGQRELYDLQKDPGELHNLIHSQPEPAKRLSDYLAEWLKRIPRYMKKKGRSAPAMKQDTLDALRSLGYLGEGD